MKNPIKDHAPCFDLQGLILGLEKTSHRPCQKYLTSLLSTLVKLLIIHILNKDLRPTIVNSADIEQRPTIVKFTNIEQRLPAYNC